MNTDIKHDTISSQQGSARTAMDDLLSNDGVGNELQAVAQAKPENNTTKHVFDH
jgi:hypothetical protein